MKLLSWNWRNRMVATVKTYPEFAGSKTKIRTPLPTIYGKGYSGCRKTCASVKKAKELLGWEPKTNFTESLRKTVEYYIKNKPERI